MYFVYIIQSIKTKEIYIGYTTDLRGRLELHNNRGSLSTKSAVPWILIYSEIYKSKKDAKLREHRLKYYGRALAQLKRRLKYSLL